MELIKKINNNFAVARDSTGQCVIVSGKGIGFEKMPGALKDLSKITRTYYHVDERYIDLIKQLPEDLVKLSTKVVDYASSKLQQKLNPNLFFTLADHLNFAVQRARQGVEFKFGITYEMRYLHADEMAIGIKVIHVMHRKFGVDLPEDEAAVIAMHILEAESFTMKPVEDEIEIKDLLSNICAILQRELNYKADQNSFNYCRFVTHIQYLLQRRGEENEITSNNKKIFQVMTQEFPNTYQSVVKIQEYLKKQLQWNISEEEMLYLMLHINRLCNNEDCNR